MKSLYLIPALALLAACGDRETRETFTCPNGPDIAVTYSEAGALVTFGDGRSELLPPTETEGVYAKPGMVWSSEGFRTARLTDGPSSYACDQMAG